MVKRGAPRAYPPDRMTSVVRAGARGTYLMRCGATPRTVHAIPRQSGGRLRRNAISARGGSVSGGHPRVDGSTPLTILSLSKDTRGALVRGRRRWITVVCAAVILLMAGDAVAQEQPAGNEGLLPTQTFFTREDSPQKVATTVEILLLLTVLSLAPAIILLMTSFTRIVIVLSFVRRAMATQEIPPNQVIVGLSLFLTFMVMTPTIQAIKRDAIDPYLSREPAQQITQQEALDRSVGHLRGFMFQHVRLKDLKLFLDISGRSQEIRGEVTREDVGTEVLIPAFVISELRRAFIMGFALFLPFVIIDLVVATTLISMGMLVLPPILISMPFKILLFILVDGWHLIVGSLVQSFSVVQ